MLKYVILDEIELELLKDDKGKTMLFNNKKKAIESTTGRVSGWQVIEIPFEEEEN